MAAAELALLGAVLGALITVLSVVSISSRRRSSAFREEHRIRALERHLVAYERMLAACRSVLDALNDYVLVDKNAADRSDPFLRLVLDMLRTCAIEYCTAVDRRYNLGMAYLDIKLEERCLRMRDLLRLWLSMPRITYDNVATVRRNGVVSRISAQEIRRLDTCDYEELRIEGQTVALRHSGDPRLISDIREAASAIIRDLKAVMSHLGNSPSMGDLNGHDESFNVSSSQADIRVNRDSTSRKTLVLSLFSVTVVLAALTALGVTRAGTSAHLTAVDLFTELAGAGTLLSGVGTMLAVWITYLDRKRSHKQQADAELLKHVIERMGPGIESADVNSLADLARALNGTQKATRRNGNSAANKPPQGKSDLVASQLTEAKRRPKWRKTNRRAIR